MRILQENQDPFYTCPQIPNHEELASASIRPQSTDPIDIMTSSPNTIQPRGSDVNKSAEYDGTAQSLLTLSPQAVDKTAFRERIEKWISEVEHGKWEDGRIRGEGDGERRVDEGVSYKKRKKWKRNKRKRNKRKKGDENKGNDEKSIAAERVSGGKRCKRDRERKYKAGDDDEVHGEESRVRERGNGGNEGFGK
ncbi:uncharacterized protein Bfra_004626 [Botrytis fragariae]|uniref:Uncharacterized protein n=1 Tax=Botrytis fragariae TaxID=1964551 RepID=A0A8H6AVT3_9HELO|nr:uncharacterized protein Bfra_004626 [Botrytis fragariae]KAF5874614.1 hypothetical protein Bfra_004626 [Botrytis fragariae]